MGHGRQRPYPLLRARLARVLGERHAAQAQAKAYCTSCRAAAAACPSEIGCGRARRGRVMSSDDRAKHKFAGELLIYDRVCRDIAAAARVDEVKKFIDISVAMRAYARQAKNHQVEADAVAIRLRATRRLDQLRQAQKETVGLATGGEHG